MARRNNNKMTKVNPKIFVQSNFNLAGNTAVSYVDVAECLSQINRKLFSQQHCFMIKSITAVIPSISLSNADSFEVQISTASDTWSVHNAWTKSKALHNEMQDLVLLDNPSIAGKWSDFKVYLDDAHLSTGNLEPRDSNLVPVQPGEWNYSQFVLPQHDVDPITGEPMVADQTFGHLLGDDIGAPGSYTSVGLIKAYAQSRATVQPTAPNVPAGFVDSFFNLLTDSGSQEPELATVIEAENDEPPYQPSNYPGGASNANDGFIAIRKLLTVHEPNLDTGAFHAQCGLIRIDVDSFLAGAAATVCPSIGLLIELETGSYKGINAIPMGQ